MKKTFLIIGLLISFIANAQDKKEEPKFGVKFSGFIKTDAFYDTRQTVNIREGNFLLYPDNILKDANQKDINDYTNFNILSIQSRVKAAVTGPEAFGAKTSGLLEADFFGNENASFSDVNGFRLRHAFVKLNWKSTELLTGQYWHPMFIAESFPGVISFNTGAPFQPFSRNPQIRLSKSFGGLKLIGCVFSQRDFVSIGPEYTLTNGKYIASSSANSKFMRNAGVPNAHFQLQYKADSLHLLAGAGIDYKVIKPELFTVNSAGTTRFSSNQTIGSLSVLAFANLNLKPINIKAQAILAENAYDLVMIGGYAVKEISDTATGKKEFTSLKTASFWADLNTTGKKVQFGLFVGYTKNLGANDTIKGAFYARGSNISYLYRVSPRIVFIAGKFNIAFENEYTFAMYGLANGTKKGEVINGKSVSNNRAMLSFIYNF
jgi:hypothetical protein